MLQVVGDGELGRFIIGAVERHLVRKTEPRRLCQREARVGSPDVTDEQGRFSQTGTPAGKATRRSDTPEGEEG